MARNEGERGGERDEMASRDWPADAPAGVDYMGFNVGDDEDRAAARFEAKHKAPPDFVFDAANVLWVGPVPGAGGLWAGGPLPADVAGARLEEAMEDADG